MEEKETIDKDFKDKKGEFIRFKKRIQTRHCIKCGYSQEERLA